MIAAELTSASHRGADAVAAAGKAGVRLAKIGYGRTS